MAACTADQPTATTPPDLAARGTTMTTVKPTRQDLANRVSLAGKVSVNPVFGLVAPIAGEVRYLPVQPTQSTTRRSGQARSTPPKPVKVANVWAAGKATPVEVPVGATFGSRLVDDRSTVTAGMPIVSAKHVGYGIVADIDAGDAYKLGDAVSSVQAQIKNGPGPFPCTVLGTIAALPPGTVPEAPAATPKANEPPVGMKPGFAGPPDGGPEEGNGGTSEPTGMRLVCVPQADIKMINGASATVEVVTEKAANAMVLPVEAIAGSQGKGKVDVVKPDGTRETRDVVLGLTDGKVVQIKSGLTGDESVGVPGPDLPEAKPAGEGGSGAPGPR